MLIRFRIPLNIPKHRTQRRFPRIRSFLADIFGSSMIRRETASFFQMNKMLTMVVDRWFFSSFNYFRIAKEEARPWCIRCVSRAAPGGRHRRPGRRGGAAGLGDGQAPHDSISPHWWRLEPNPPPQKERFTKSMLGPSAAIASLSHEGKLE